MKPETLASVGRGLRNKLTVFVTDPYINHAFRGQREGANCFTWDDLDRCNIFLRIPAGKIEQWGGVINLMYTQLIRHLERRPEMHSPEGAGNIQTLLLMDEFPRFGKLEMISAAVSTLRSKNVNICLMIQSIAQLDKIYAAIHRGRNHDDPSRNNPHAHIIVPTRPVGADGFCKRKDREHDKRKYIIIWREQWAAVQNRAYERNGLDIQVSHESLKVQGKRDREPTIHLSRIDWQREQRGEHTSAGDRKRAIKERNEERIQQRQLERERRLEIERSR